MGSLWRSEDMDLVMMTMQREAAHDTVAALGELSLVEFKDLNYGINAFQRQYANEVKRCDELERILRFFESELAKIPVERAQLPLMRRELKEETLDALETTFDTYETELRELSNNLEQMQLSYNNTKELFNVLEQGEGFFSGSREEMITDTTSSSSDTTRSLLEEGMGRQGGLGYITGVIPTEKKNTFVLLLYRATRGNMLPKFAEIEEPIIDPSTGASIEKSVFIVFFSAERAREKIKKICESLGAHIHQYPEGNVTQEKLRLRENLRELEETIRTTSQRRQDLLSEISINVERWKLKVAKEKSIYHVMNMFDHKTSQHSVIAQAWVPSKYIDRVRSALKEAEHTSGAQVESYCEKISTKEVHPTYFEVNKFTATFQQIVDSYGIARYKELNPAVLTITTFPFLFAVMFGDAGHGIIFSMFALTLVLLEKRFLGKPMNELFGMLFEGRYILLMMGIFSIFTGLLYNDWFSLSTNFFHSAWHFPHHATNGTNNEDEPLPYKDPNWTYPFGVDPAWVMTSNKLNYYNSLKMKLSVIMGVLQMIAGLVLSLFNHIYFKHYVDILFEFLPEVIFLGFTFGYMCVIIIIKWCLPVSRTNDVNLLQTMTSFFLQPNPTHMSQVQLYPGQAPIQFILLIIAVLMLPMLLFPKPIAEWYFHKKHVTGHHELPSDAESDDAELGGTHASGPPHEEEEPFQFSEALIKQVIHTIEFALGCVSNTASYLRLWALSLAHSQLSEVFFNMTILMVLNMDPHGGLGKFLDLSGIGYFIAFAVWFCATVVVLLVMESLSAFLHALRLHWVEFQSKFYGGDGKKFIPLNFNNLLGPKDEE